MFILCTKTPIGTCETGLMEKSVQDHETEDPELL